MNVYLSNKITFFRFLGVFFVLYIHSFLPDIQNGSFFSGIQFFFSDILSRTFQPIYFGISGYLFFTDTQHYNLFCFRDKLKKRAKKLLIPYVIWNLIAFSEILIFRIIMEDGSVVNNLSSLSHHSFLSYLFVVPAGGHLWFIRDLIIINLISYPLFLFLKYFKWVSFLIIFALACLGVPLMFSLFSFSFGAYLFVFKVDVLKKSWLLIIISFVLLICTLIYYCVIYKQFNYFVFVLSWPIFYLLWVGYDFFDIYSIVNRRCFNICASSGFFVYLFHEPLLGTLKYILIPFYENNTVLQYLIYFSLPFAVFSLSLFIGVLLKWKLRPLYSLLTGER